MGQRVGGDRPPEIATALAAHLLVRCKKFNLSKVSNSYDFRK